MTMIPEAYLDLIDGPVVVSLVTVMPDGQPQVTPVWANRDGDFVLVNSAAGRRKDRNMRANPKVAVMVLDPKNPYRWLEVRGEVVEITEEGARDHIDALAKLYTGRDDFYSGDEQRATQETRVIYRIKPTKVNASG